MHYAFFFFFYHWFFTLVWVVEPAENLMKETGLFPQLNEHTLATFCKQFKEITERSPKAHLPTLLGPCP